MADHEHASRDIYGRSSTSTSRGKTIPRIMALQHAAGVIPGTEHVLLERPRGSIAAAIVGFHEAWVEQRKVTTRRAYERSLALFSRDLADAGDPTPQDPLAALTAARLATHLDWRLARGLHDPGELQRAGLHLARLCTWADEHMGGTINVDRAWLRACTAERIALAPPPFHAARHASELRDVTGDEQLLGGD